MDQTGTLKHFSKYLVWLPDHSVVPWFWFGWLWVVTVMTNKCLVRPETGRAGPGVVGCVSLCLSLSPVTPALAGVGWPEPPEKVSRVSVSQCWLRHRSRQTPSLSRLRTLQISRSLQSWLTDSDRMLSEIFPEKTRDWHWEWRIILITRRSDGGGLGDCQDLPEHLRIPQIPVCYLTWQWARRNTRQANYQQLPAQLQSHSYLGAKLQEIWFPLQFGIYNVIF